MKNEGERNRLVDKILTADQVREIIANAMDKELGIEISASDIGFEVIAEMVCINMNEDYAPKATFKGAIIRRKD